MTPEPSLDPSAAARAEVGAHLPSWLDRPLRWIDPEANPGATVYGIFAVGLLLAAEDPARESYPKVVGATLLGIAGYWLAHGYATWLGHRLGAAEDRGGDRPEPGLLRVLSREFALVEGALVPVVVMAIVWLIGARLGSAVTAAMWAAASVIVAVELAAGVRRRLPPSRLVGNALVGGVLAAVLFGVKAVLY